jgi:muramoyltetrapeptide carboxypeptidase
MVKCSLISPAYPCTGEEIKTCYENFEKLGFNEVQDLTNKEGLFNKWAGSHTNRLNSFYESWNSDSNLVMCCKGGSGVSHLIPLINSKKLKKKKLFVGYSDISMFLIYLHKKLGIITLHGPNASKELDKQSIFFLKKALSMESYGLNLNRKEYFNHFKSKIKGKTIGGNLGRVLETAYLTKLDFKDKIVFFEETLFNEHKIFNLLVSFKNYPGFKPRAILFGDLGVKDNELMRIMIKYVFPNTPLVFGLSFGHCKPNITIPIGVDCEIDFNNKKIKFIFSKKHKKYSVGF